MKYYIKEDGFYYSKLHGPYNTIQEAMNSKPKDLTVGKGEAQIRYTIVEAGDGSPVQLLNE